VCCGATFSCQPKYTLYFLDSIQGLAKMVASSLGPNGMNKVKIEGLLDLNS
jgi:hypothetical protein